MINQNFENITQSGTTQSIEANVTGMELTSVQFYSCLFCVTLILITLIIMVSKLIQTAILRTNYISPKIIKQLKDDILQELRWKPFVYLNHSTLKGGFFYKKINHQLGGLSDLGEDLNYRLKPILLSL